MTGGTGWTTSGALILENIGNENVQLNLSSNKSADDFIGGTNPLFQAKVTDESEESCDQAGGVFENYNNITTAPQVACTNFTSVDTNDTIEIEFQLYIPSDASGTKTVEIIAIGYYP